MRAVWLEVPEAFLKERARLDQDRKDELWEGELHMVPPPSFTHELVTFDLMFALKPIADRRALRVHGPTTGMFAATDDYRIPDITMFRPDRMTERGLSGAELVVEVLSPQDESRKKLGFYAKRDVGELWLVDPKTRAFELFVLADSSYRAISPIAGVYVSSLGVELELAAGKLRLRDGDYVVDV